MGSGELTESQIQIQVADWLRLHEASGGFVFFSVPNEALGRANSKAGLWRMARLKHMGLRPGAPDLIIIKAGRAYLLEMKAEHGKQSISQVEFEADAIRAGAKYAVAHSFDEAKKIIEEWAIFA